MRSSLVVRASDCQCTSCNGPGFDPSIRRLSGIWGAADEAVLNIVKKKRKNPPGEIFRERYTVYGETWSSAVWMERARIIIRAGDGGGLKVMGGRGTVPPRHMDNYPSPFPLAYSFLSLCSRYMFAYTRLQWWRVFFQCIRYYTKAEKTGNFPPFIPVSYGAFIL